MDYKKLGFRCGLELHQQIDGKKLFCNCPCIIKDTPPDFTFKRSLRASASELGEVDKAALHEVEKEKYFVYQGYKNINCLVELDEEPPKEVNKDALDICLQVALLLNCKIVDKIEFMRKVVIDGSNVSGFQRTGLVGVNGYVETSEGKISIDSVCLEEEAAKKLNDNEDFRTYNLSRLGIPLIEVATGPDVRSAEGAKEAAAKLGMILRSVEGIKRGIGSIRQDVNVSIKGHPRVEIKGFQEIKFMPLVIMNEVDRQLKEVKSNKELKSHVRNSNKDGTSDYLRPMPGSARMYPETDVKSIVLSSKYLKGLRLPVLIDEKIEGVSEKHSIDPDQVRVLLRMDKLDLFEKVVSSCKGLDARYVAEVMISLPKELRRKYKQEVVLDDFFVEVMKGLSEERISKNSLIQIYLDKKKEGFDMKNYEVVSGDHLEKDIKEIILKNKAASFNALMGEVMKHFKGKVDGRKVAELIKKNM